MIFRDTNKEAIVTSHELPNPDAVHAHYRCSITHDGSKRANRWVECPPWNPQELSECRCYVCGELFSIVQKPTDFQHHFL